MNRQYRRASASRERNRKRHNALYDSYVRHLPVVPLEAPLQPGVIDHLVFHHDNWCRFYDSNSLSECNCNPVVTRHREPTRS